MKIRSVALMAVISLAAVVSSQSASGWGPRGHTAIDRAALETLPEDGPVFLKSHIDFIGNLALLPDAWRAASEPFSKMAEDPNHGWFREQFLFMKDIPRSRHEFLIALLDEQRRVEDPTSDAALRTNVRWTGTLPYAVMEAYGRLVAGMRVRRNLAAENRPTDDLDIALAFDVVRLGHYVGDGAQPLHVSIHSDGWRGENPHDYTRDRRIHGWFESRFVDAIELSERDVIDHVAEPGRQNGDVFELVLMFLDDSGDWMEQVYRFEAEGALEDPNHVDARNFVYERTGFGASMLRDLLYRAWRESAMTPEIDQDPLDPANPAYNSETGSAPAPVASFE